ncbi:hypothetical protein ACVNSK_10605 [Corynebacterium propinquum]
MAKDSRLYGKFTLDFPEHEKIFILSDAAFRMLVEMTLYSSKMQTDGRVSKRLARARWSLESARELLANDPEKPSIYEDGNDYVIHDFAKHQVTKADLEAKKEAGRRGGLAKSRNLAAKKRSSKKGSDQAGSSKPVAGAREVLKQTSSKPVAGALADGYQSSSKPLLDRDIDIHSSSKEEHVQSGSNSSNEPANSYPAAFERWWSAYPRKQGKRKALAEWRCATKRIDRDELVTKTTRFADFHAREGTDKQFIPLPTTWLNRDGWDDELISRNTQNSWASVASLLDRKRDQDVIDGEIVDRKELPF